jgi:glycosyltransferase involved in cell wall biosynthesis
MPKKRVLVLAEFDDRGGTGIYLKRLLEYLGERYSVRLVVDKDQGASALIPYFENLGIRVSLNFTLFPGIDQVLRKIFRRLKVIMFYDFFRDSAIRRRLERNYKPDLICISQGRECNYFGFLRSRKPMFVVTHSLFGESITRNFAGALYASLYDGIQTRNKRICMVSKFARERFMENIHSKKLASCSVHIWNYGASTWPFSPKPHDGITVLTLGHLVGYKNPQAWLQAGTELTEKYPNRVRFLWAGSGGLLKELRQSVIGNGAIEFLGFVEDTETLYRRADIYFQPSIWENHSISVVEAMAHALPCVVSNVGGMQESIEDGKEGFVMEPMDVGGYVGALSRLIENPEMIKAMGMNARVKYEALFTKDRWSAAMDATLREILGDDA